MMTIKRKIQAKEEQRGNEDLLGKATRTAFFRIFCGYIGGTIIGLIIRRVIYG